MQRFLLNHDKILLVAFRPNLFSWGGGVSFARHLYQDSIIAHFHDLSCAKVHLWPDSRFFQQPQKSSRCPSTVCSIHLLPQKPIIDDPPGLLAYKKTEHNPTVFKRFSGFNP